MKDNDKIFDNIHRLIYIEEAIPNKLLAVFDNELIFGFSWRRINLKEDEISCDFIQKILSGLYRVRRIKVEDVLEVSFVKPASGRFFDKSWRLIIYSKSGKSRMTLPFEDGQNIFEYFESKMPDRLKIVENSLAHFFWRFRKAFLWYIFIVLCLGILLFALNIFLPGILILLFIFLGVGLFTVFLIAIIPRNQYILPEEDTWNLKQKSEDKVKPLISPLLGWTLKILGVGWFFFGILVIEKQYWFQEMIYKSSYIPGGLSLLLYMPTAMLVYSGYQLCQKIQKKEKYSADSPNILYLRAFDDDQRITLQPTSGLAVVVGLIDLMPFNSIRSGLDGARFRSLKTFAYLFNPIRVIRLFFNKGADTCEEVISSYFSKLGNVIAVGQPGQRLVTPGAKRIYLEDSEWQSKILEYLEQAWIVIIQPGAGAGVRWEIEKTFEIVPFERILLSLACFWKRPEMFENFLQTLPENLRQKIPREIPSLERPAFLYFEKDGMPILQLISYRSPILWAFLGNAVDLGYTLKSFLQGINGEHRENPAVPKKHYGHQSVAWAIGALMLALALFPLISNYVYFFLRENIQKSPMIEYKGKAAPYSVKLRKAWIKLADTNTSKSLDYEFNINYSPANIRFFSFKEPININSIPQDRLEGVKNTPFLALAQVGMKGYKSLVIDRQSCVKTQIDIELKSGDKFQELSLACSGDKGAVLIYASIPANDPLYTKLIEEMFASLKFN